MKSRRVFAPRVETLDDRNLLSILLTNGLLDVIGSTVTDQIRITLPAPGQIGVTIDTTGESQTFDRSAVTGILVRSRAGDDFIVIGPNITQPTEVRAWAGADRVLGGGGGDTLLGGGGDDVVDGRGGDDTIIGQDGHDFLLGNAGNDTIYGDFTTDKPTGGIDIIDGGDGNDTITTGVGDDSADGGTGSNVIDGVPDGGGGGGGGGGGTGGDDGFESNDTMQTAASLGDLTSPQTINSLALLNEDWFQFGVPATGLGGSVAINFDAAQGDLDMEMYDSSGLLVDLSEDVTDSEAVSLGGRPAGTYFVRVYGFEGVTNPSYSMTLTPTEGGGGGGGDDQFEDNDTFDTATGLGTVTDATNLTDLSLQDDDWFQFTTTGTGRIDDSISIYFQQALGDLDMELYDAGGTLIDVANGIADTEFLSLEGLPADTYFVRVLGFDGATNPVYSMSVVPPGGDDSYEDNDSGETASDLGELTNDLTVNDLTLKDDDWFRFSIPTAGTAADFVSLDFVHALGDIDMQLFDAFGNEVGLSDGSVDGEFISLEGLPAGTYFIRAYGFDGAANPTYSLVVAPPLGGGGSGGTDDTFEENDSFGAASDLGTVSDTRTVTDLVMNDAADWYRFTTTGTGDAGSSVQIFFEHSQGDLDMRLFDAGGNQLGISQGTSASEGISLNGLPAGTYFVEVYGFQGVPNPSYAMTITPPTGGTTGGGGATGDHVLYLSTEGYSMSHSELQNISGGWSIDSVTSFDADGNGIQVQPFLADRADREEVITQLIGRLQDDLTQFGITVQRISGGPVTGQGATTLFMGRSTLTNDLYHVACDIDVGNDNPTDIAFVGDENWGSTADTALALADVAIHEAGHTFGLYHVQSGTDLETMGLRYNTPQDSWLANTSFTGSNYSIFPGHGPASNQNSFQTISRAFGTGTGNLVALSPPGGLQEPAAFTLMSSADVMRELFEDAALHHSDSITNPQLAPDAGATSTAPDGVVLHGANDPGLTKFVPLLKSVDDPSGAKPAVGDSALGVFGHPLTPGGESVSLLDLDGDRLTLSAKR